MTVTVTGMAEVHAYLLNLLHDALTFTPEGTVYVGSTAPYALGIETGFNEQGRLARRAGAVRYLQNAYNDVAPAIPSRIVESIEAGETAQMGLYRAGLEMQARAAVYEDVVSKTGALYESIQTVDMDHPAQPFVSHGRSMLPRETVTRGGRPGRVAPILSRGLRRSMLPRQRAA